MALEGAGARRPVQGCLPEAASQRQSAEPPPAADEPPTPEEESAHVTANVVQFASAITYAREDDDDGGQDIWMMRIGDVRSECSVKVSTKKNPLAGKKFRAISGEEVVFKPGEMMRCFRLELYQDDAYGNVTQVHIEVDKESCKNCAVGNFLYQTRVKIIDDDTFPSNKIKDLLEREAFKQEGVAFSTKGAEEQSSWSSMFLELAKYMFAQNQGGAIRVLLADQINNMIFISRVLLQRSVINELSGDEPDFHRFLALASGLALPYAITHALSYQRQFWRVGGSARQSLLVPLLQRFMNYEEGSRAMVDSAQVKHVFMDETLELVSSGYMQFFVLAASLGKVAMIIAFSGYLSLDTVGSPLFFIAVWVPIPVVTVLAFVFFRLRFAKTEAALKEVEEAKVDLVYLMSNCVNSYRFVAEHLGRELVLGQCSDKVKTLNGSLVRRSVRGASDMAFLGWCKKLIEFEVMATMGACVIYYGLPLGSFTAALFCARAAICELQRICNALAAMQSCYPALWHMVQYLNHPTDLLDRKKTEDEKMSLCRVRLEEKVSKEKNVAEGGVPVPYEDQLEITFENVEFAYFKRLAGTAKDNDHIFRFLELTIKQGQLLAVLGASDGGTKTVGRLLSGALLPTDGRVFVPPHIRPLFVQFDDEIWNGPIAYSLFFGLMSRRLATHLNEIEHDELKRGEEICRCLKMPEDAMDQITRSVDFLTSRVTSQSSALSRPSQSSALLRVESAKTLSSLSKSTLCKIQLASALIADPELLVLNKPIQRVSLQDAEEIMAVLKQYVKSRGFMRDEASIESRRLRTCVITTSSLVMLSGVDQAVRLNEKGSKVDEVDVDTELNKLLETGRSSGD